MLFSLKKIRKIIKYSQPKKSNKNNVWRKSNFDDYQGFKMNMYLERKEGSECGISNLIGFQYNKTYLYQMISTTTKCKFENY